MALFFHSDDVDQLISIKEAVGITENALRDLSLRAGVNAPRKRLNLHRKIGEYPYDAVLNVYAGGSGSYGAIGAQVALHRKAIEGTVQKRPPYNADQTELALIYDVDRLAFGHHGASPEGRSRDRGSPHSSDEFGRP